MTAFLPNAPRRKWHPSEWNIVRVGTAIGTALALGACGDDVTTAETTAEESETGYDEYTEWTDYSEYTDYADWSEEYTDYSDYSDWNDEYTDYTDYTDYTEWSEYTDYSDSYWYPECYIDEDCGPGWQCIDYYCSPGSECRTSSDCPDGEFCDDNKNCVGVELSEECLAPALQQIPLPAEAGGVIVALRFVDLDGDAAQELVLLRNDAIVVVDGDQATTAPHGAFALDGLAATDVDEDGVLDIVATSSTKLNARVFHGDGFGGFVDSGTGPAMMLDQAHGIDWPSGGAGELLARTQADEAVILSNVAQQVPDIEPLEMQTVAGLAAGQFGGSDETDIAVLRADCTMPTIAIQNGGSFGTDALGPPGMCSLAAGSFDGDDLTDVVILRADASFSVVNVLAPPEAPPSAVGLMGAYQAARPAVFGGAFAVLVQSGPALELLFTDAQLGAWCRGPLDELPPVLRFALGDFDGDGDDELATVDSDGAIALWADE